MNTQVRNRRAEMRLTERELIPVTAYDVRCSDGLPGDTSDEQKVEMN